MHELGFIHRFEPGSSSTTLLLLHGTGADENDLIGLGRILDPNANLLSPRGQVLEDGAPRFFRRLAPGVFDVEDLKTRTQDLARFIESAANSYSLDLKHMVAVGYSNGANIAASLLFMQPGLITRAALLHPMVPFDPDPVPELAGSRVLITGGRRDPIVPVEQTERLAEMLNKSGAEVAARWTSGGHELTQEEVDLIGEWLRDA